VTEKANPHILTVQATQNKSSGSVNATEQSVLRAAACVRLMSTNLMKNGTLVGTTAEVNKISTEKEK
jgi:hypothetical protein